MNRTSKSVGFHSLVSCLYFLIVGALTGILPRAARADAFATYQLVETFQVPADTGPLDTLGDGRIILLAGDRVFLETAVGSRSFALKGALSDADIPSFGAAFISVSPDDTKIAVGNNGGSSFVDFKVGILNIETLEGTWYVANHFVAEWISDTHLALAVSDFANGSYVTVLDTTSLDPENPDNPRIIDNVGGASGGLSFDAFGNLFMGNGFATIGPSGTGTVKAFSNASWTGALAGGTALDFEVEGTLIVDVLSAGSLRFDTQGNLFVTGGATAPDNDSIALVRASAVAAALAGMGPADPDNPAQVRRLDPITTSDFNFYSADHNAATGELYVRDFGDQTIYVYRDVAPTVPTTSEWSAFCMALLMLTTGTLVIQGDREKSPWRTH